MLLCHLDHVAPGATIAASVFHPRQAGRELLRRGVQLDQRLIHRLQSLGVREIWVDHDAMGDLDAQCSANLTESRQEVFKQLKQDFNKLATDTISTAQVQKYRQVMMDLTCEIISARKYAGLTDRIHDHGKALFTHCANVAYLSLLVGLELEDYLVLQRRKLDVTTARDVTALGMGAMLHDVGKTRLSHETRHFRCIDGLDEPPWSGDTGDCEEADAPEDYVDHPLVGYRLMRGHRAPAPATQIVLCHHQRFNGSGFPDMTEITHGRQRGTQKHEHIHVFSRIVAVANVLDHLLHEAYENNRPPIAAIHSLLSHQFDGWFDPVIVHRLVSHIPPFPIGSEITLNTGQPAAVVAPNVHCPCRPVVRLLAESTRLPDGQYPTVRLSDEPQYHIVGCMGLDVQRWLYDLPPMPRALAG